MLRANDILCFDGAPARCAAGCRWVDPEVCEQYGIAGTADEAWEQNGGGKFSFKIDRSCARLLLRDRLCILNLLRIRERWCEAGACHGASACMLAKAGASLVKSATAGARRLCAIRAQSCCAWRRPAQGSQHEQQALEAGRDLPCPRWSTGTRAAWPTAARRLPRAAIPPALRGKGWSDARAFAATQLRKNPNSYFYRHVAPDQVQVRARARGGATRASGSGCSASQEGVAHRVLAAEGGPDRHRSAHVCRLCACTGCAMPAPNRVAIGLSF
jgi:hypothetical protein